MNMKKILFALVVTSLLIGGACAASVSGFTVDKSYKNVYSSEYYSVYADSSQDSGILVFKNVNDDAYDDKVNDDILDHTIHHDGKEYITPDDDIMLTKNSDNSANFTDSEHSTHGVAEVISADGQEYIVVSWAKDSSNIDTAKLMSILQEFNKNNNVKPVTF